MSQLSKKAIVFIMRDFRVAASYRLLFVMNGLSIFITVASFYYISKTFGGSSELLRPYGGEYFPFILIGMAFFNYVFTGIGVFSGAIRREQVMGTLEAVLMSPTKLPVLIFFLSLWSFLYSTLMVIAYMFVGVVFFGLSVSVTQMGIALVFLIPSIIVFSSLGIISASFVLVFKKGDPIKWLISIGSSFLSGTFFPIAVLPQRLQQFSKYIPTTYTLHSLRLLLLKGAAFEELSTDFYILLLFCVIFLPLSVIIFSLAMRKAKRDGALAYY